MKYGFPVILAFTTIACAPSENNQQPVARQADTDTAAAVAPEMSPESAVEQNPAESPAADAPTEDTTADQHKQSTSETPADIPLIEGTWDDVQKAVADNSGKVVVVDFWSTSCLPCVEEFPNLVALQKTHGDAIACISVNLDYAGIKSKPPEYYRPRVQKFLSQTNARIQNYLSTMEAADVLNAANINSVPTVFVYGTDGQLAKRFDESLLTEGEEEAFTYEQDINPFVQSLLTP